jgi:hypothetical protein
MNAPLPRDARPFSTTVGLMLVVLSVYMIGQFVVVGPEDFLIATSESPYSAFEW